MDERALKTLLRLELRRTFRPLRRGVTLAAVAALLVGLLRGWNSELLWMLLLGSGPGYVVQVPAGVVRDRLGGELSVLAWLPVSAGTVVAGKFGAAIAVSAVGAFHWSLAAVLLLRGDALSLDPVAAAAGAFFWGWLALATGCFLSIALVARFDVETLAAGPVPAAVLLLLGVTWFVERSVPEPWVHVAWILDRPWLPLAAAGVGLLGSALVTAIAFRTASAAVGRAGDPRHTSAR